MPHTSYHYLDLSHSNLLDMLLYTYPEGSGGRVRSKRLRLVEAELWWEGLSSEKKNSIKKKYFGILVSYVSDYNLVTIHTNENI